MLHRVLRVLRLGIILYKLGNILGVGIQLAVLIQVCLRIRCAQRGFGRDLGPVLVPAVELVARIRSRGRTGDFLVRQNLVFLACRINAAVRLGFIRYRVGLILIDLPLRVQDIIFRSQLVLIAGGISLAAAIDRGVPAGELVAGLGKVVGRNSNILIHNAGRFVHMAGTAVAVITQPVGIRLPLRVEDIIFRSQRVRRAGGIRRSAAIGSGVPAGEGVARLGKAIGRDRHIGANFTLGGIHLAGTGVGIIGQLVGIAFPNGEHRLIRSELIRSDLAGRLCVILVSIVGRVARCLGRRILIE